MCYFFSAVKRKAGGFSVVNFLRARPAFCLQTRGAYVKLIAMRMHRKDNLEARLLACADVMTAADLTEKNMKVAAQMKDYIDFATVFGNSAPVHLEIGCGKGGFVCGMARLHPDINFVAVERVSNVIITACEAVKQQGIKNVHFINCPAEVLPRYIREGSIQRIYLNFSDPLPKLGYSSQRLTNPRFLDMYKVMLAEGGELWQKTDNEAFFEYSLQSFKECGWTIKEVCRDLAAHPFAGNVITEHEKKFMEEGRKIFRAVVTP